MAGDEAARASTRNPVDSKVEFYSHTVARNQPATR